MKSFTLNIFTLFTLLIMFSPVLKGQNNWCGTDEYNQNKLEKDPVLRDKVEKEQELIRQTVNNFSAFKNSSVNTTKIIPTVVHIIHSNGIGNISKSKVEDGIRILNEDFKKLNSDTIETRDIFKSLGSNLNCEFRLAQIDPNGNCTEGIVRVNSPLSYNANDDVKALSYWPSDKYFNIWLVNSIENFSGGGGTILGYAQFPGWGAWETYGFVNRNDYWGFSSTGEKERTPTHEIGHCVGLFHTFQSGCGSDCSNSGDQVCDTPPVKNATWGCSSTQNSCSNDVSAGSAFTSDVVDQLENYMSYDVCQNMFTVGQQQRAEAVFNNYAVLQNLISPANHIATGTNDGYTASPCIPIAELLKTKTSVCKGGSISFSDISWNGPVANRSWFFEGGTPATSSDSVAIIQYTQPGTYNVSLIVQNIAGADSIIKNDFIYVIADTGSALPFVQGFENGDESYFITLPELTTSWKAFSTGNTSGQSLMVENYYASPGVKSEVISSPVDLSSLSSILITFDVAYAQKLSTDADALRLYISTNCGATWTNRWSSNGSNLASTAPVSGYFTPTDSQWRTFSITYLPASYFVPNFLFKFQFETKGGNNIYIDNINISGTVGVDQKINRELTFAIQPNPVKDEAKISFDLKEKETVLLSVSDVLGREILLLNQDRLQPGNHSFPINNSLLNPGIYFVKLEINGDRLVKKIVIE